MCQSTDFLFCLCYVRTYSTPLVSISSSLAHSAAPPVLAAWTPLLVCICGWGGGDCSSYFQRNDRPAKILGNCVLAPSLNDTQRARSSASLVYRAGCTLACSLNACVLPQNVGQRTGPQGVGEEALSEHSFPLGEKKVDYMIETSIKLRAC